jgi:hypothetical protein
MVQVQWLMLGISFSNLWVYFWFWKLFLSSICDSSYPYFCLWYAILCKILLSCVFVAMCCCNEFLFVVVIVILLEFRTFLVLLPRSGCCFRVVWV